MVCKVVLTINFKPTTHIFKRVYGVPNGLGSLDHNLRLIEAFNLIKNAIHFFQISEMYVYSALLSYYTGPDSCGLIYMQCHICHILRAKDNIRTMSFFSNNEQI